MIHNVSTEVALGPCGLKGDNFGQAVSLYLFDHESDDFYDKIRANRAVSADGVL